MIIDQRFQPSLEDGPIVYTVPALAPAPITRGPGWVLTWGAAGSLVIFVAILLLQFGLMLVNERKLASAAERAVAEAVLPHATTESVTQAARRALGVTPRLAVSSQAITRVNGRLQHAATELQVEPGDVVTVQVAAFAIAAVPDWLSPLGLSIDHQVLQATAKRRRP